MELRLEEMCVKLTEYLIFINVFEFLHKPWGKNLKSYSSCKVPFLKLSLSSHDPENGRTNACAGSRTGF